MAKKKLEVALPMGVDGIYSEVTIRIKPEEEKRPVAKLAEDVIKTYEALATLPTNVYLALTQYMVMQINNTAMLQTVKGFIKQLDQIADEAEAQDE